MRLVGQRKVFHVVLVFTLFLPFTITIEISIPSCYCNLVQATADEKYMQMSHVSRNEPVQKHIT